MEKIKQTMRAIRQRFEDDSVVPKNHEFKDNEIGAAEYSHRNRSASYHMDSSVKDGKNMLHDVKRSLLTLNPYTNVRLLFPETQTASRLIVLDGHSFISLTGNEAPIWNATTAKLVTILQGHTRAIITAAPVQRTVATSSHDGTLRLWDPSSGECRNVILTNDDVIHTISEIANSTFCCAGQNLYVFACTGVLLAKCPQSDASLFFHSILVLKWSILAALTDSCGIWVLPRDAFGSLTTLTDDDEDTSSSALQLFHPKPDHEHPITCLVQINESFFASGCKGGAVFLWQSKSLHLVKVLRRRPENFYCKETKLYISQITAILALSKDYVAVAVNHGFKIIATKDSKTILSVKDAHGVPIHKLFSMHYGHFLLTCAGDSVKLWCVSQVLFEKAPSNSEEQRSMLLRSLSSSEKMQPDGCKHNISHLPAVLQKFVDQFAGIFFQSVNK